MRFIPFSFMTATPSGGAPTPSPGLDGQYVIAYGSDYSFNNYGIYISSNYGATFSYSTALFANISAMSNDGSYMYISGVDGGEQYIYKSINFGGSWSKIYSLTGVTSSSIRTMSCSQNGQFIALGNVYSNDYGVSFQTQTSATNAASSDWILPDNSRMYQGGTAGGSTNLLSYRPNLTGSFTTIGTSQRWTQVVASSDNTFILAATDDNPTSPNWIRPTYLSTNSGSTFTAIGGTNSNYGSSVTISDNGQYMLALSGSLTSTQDVTLIASSNSGTTFTSTGLNVSDTGNISPYMSYVLMSSNGQYQYASADYTFGVGNIYRSTNYGSTWSRISQSLRIVPLATNRYKI